MQSKLEELARKEEELRKINEALDLKREKYMADGIKAAAGTDLRNDPEYLAQLGNDDDGADEENKSSENSFDDQ